MQVPPGATRAQRVHLARPRCVNNIEGDFRGRWLIRVRSVSVLCLREPARTRLLLEFANSRSYRERGLVVRRRPRLAAPATWRLPRRRPRSPCCTCQARECSVSRQRHLKWDLPCGWCTSIHPQHLTCSRARPQVEKGKEEDEFSPAQAAAAAAAVTLHIQNLQTTLSQTLARKAQVMTKDKHH